jgi:two-component system response regulator PilR (NtrC family)
MATILIVDDEKKMRHLLSIMLQRQGHQIEEAGDGVEALEMLKTQTYDMVITDIKMPRMDGIALLNKLKEVGIDCPVVFITAFATVDSAVDAMRRGAADYITKPFDGDRIVLTVERTLNLSRVLVENRHLKNELGRLAEAEEIIYVSKEMSQLMDLATRVADSESAVLINGESGTGKELLAKFIHRASARSRARFVPVNCAAISPQLVESELFGHERGSFTGADKTAVGKFEYASGGTLFLDEIGDLPAEAQAKLLRALQEKKIQRVGGNDEIAVDVRVICATNQNLEALVESGAFRQDLYFRINVVPINPPPLRNRKTDILPLANYFLRRVGGERAGDLSKEAVRQLENYSWPGNVRELANAMERVLILAGDQKTITAENLSFLKPSTCASNGQSGFRLPPEGISLEAFEKKIVLQALEATGDNQTRAAELLGLSRAKFRVLMRQARENKETP